MHKSTVAGLFLGLGVALGLVLAAMAPQSGPPQPVEWLQQPRMLEPFSLRTGTGSFSNETLQGHWTVVVFGFLNCPDVCPTSLAQMAVLKRRLADHAAEAEVRFVFVSVDPGRDSITEVDQYARYFDAAIRGVTGTPQQLARFATRLGIQFSVRADENEYRVAHSSTFSIIGPEGRLRGRFRPGFAVAELVRSFRSKLAATRAARTSQISFSA